MKLNLKQRAPVKEAIKTHAEEHPFVDEAGRLRLKDGDVVGVKIDTGSHYGDGQITFFVNGLQVHETLHMFTEPGEQWYPFVCLGSDKIRVRLMSPGEGIQQGCWDVPEEHAIRKADIAWAMGEPPFEGQGWLSRKHVLGLGWTKSWYSLQISALRYTPYPVLFITLHKGHALAAMDVNGLSDPYVEFRCGEKPWKDGMPRDDPNFTMVKSETKYKTLEPVWDNVMELKVTNLRGTLSVHCWDKDRLRDKVLEHKRTDDLVGQMYINIESITDLCCTAKGVRKLQHKWYTIKAPGKSAPRGHLNISMHIGEKEHDPEHIKKPGVLSLHGGFPEAGEMLLEHITLVRPGERPNELRFDWKDPNRAKNSPREVTLRAADDKERDDWLSVLNLFVCRRFMIAKALLRTQGILTGLLPRPRSPVGDNLSIIDPSTYLDFGFSRVARAWNQHPLKRSDPKLKQGYPIAFECQFSDSDIVAIAPQIKECQWVMEIRFDCFCQVGYIKDEGAKALAEALERHQHVRTLNLKGNMITDQGAEAFAQMIRRNTKMQYLRLDGNNITTLGAIKLLTALTGDAMSRPNKSMQELGLTMNYIPELETGWVGNCFVSADIA